MSVVFDFHILFFLVLAVLIFLRLYAVLGWRTGKERRIGLSFPEKRGPEKGGEGAQSAGGERQGAPDLARQHGAEKAKGDVRENERRWAGYAPSGTPLARAFDDIAAVDPGFSPKAFIKGAQVAYGMIVEAFERGDKAQLQHLLAPDVYTTFVCAIDGRPCLTPDETLSIGIQNADIIDGWLEGSFAFLTVRFVSSVTTDTPHAQRGKTVGSGETPPSEMVRRVEDLWTFSRDLASRNPNWTLTMTRSG